MAERVFIDTNVFIHAEDGDGPAKRAVAQRRIRAEHVLGAVDLASLHALSLWDALIIRAALASGCARLLSEDLDHGQVIDAVRIEDPFRGVAG